MKKLTFKEFKPVVIDAALNLKVYTYKEKGIELCLEPCANGFDVALYDDKQEIIYPKKCTNLKKVCGVAGMIKAINAGVKYANELYQQYHLT